MILKYFLLHSYQPPEKYTTVVRFLNYKCYKGLKLKVNLEYYFKNIILNKFFIH